MTTTDNLPTWSGAAEAYSRAYCWTNAVAAEAYRTWAAGKRKQRFTAPDDVLAMIDALNKGDQETIKGLNHRYIRYWLPA